MSLYDIMSKRPEEPEGQEVPVAAPVQQEVVQAQEPAAEKKDRLWWWQTPDFMGAVAAQEKAAEKRMEQEKKRARRQRNMAILGDIARLGAQTGAIAGGAWIADPFTPATEKANDNLAALRERHAAEVAAFARQRAAAQEKLAADNNAKEKLREALENEERKEEATQDYRERKLENDAMRIAIAKQNADTAAQNAAGKKKTDATYEEYYKWLEKYPEIKVQKAVAKRNAYGGYEKNDDGTQAYEYVDNENPSLREVENAIAKAKDLERRGVKGATPGEKKGSNGLGWGNKNKNSETDW